MFDQATCADTPNATSSLASVGGASRCAWLDGQTIDLFGPVPVLANLSARQAKELGLLTSGTYGPPSTGSSSSADLQSSLASRLQAATASTGSTLYALTWKVRPTPLGRPICALRASVRRTSASGSTGWPTPVARDHFPAHSPDYIAAKKAQGHGMSNLNDTVQLAGWPTTSCSNDRTGTPESALKMTRKDGSKVQQRLQDFAVICQPIRYTASGLVLTGSDAGMENSGQLNPDHSRWLMGYPPAWQHCVVTAMQSFQRRPRRS
ncbi:hypothetical protein RT95_20690 [Xanthomonas campestris]|nr:hypothetical protein RT95_20690 [Xanthomonas campestris]